MLGIDSSAVLWKEVNGAVVVLLISRSNFIELNKAGSAIWKLIAANKTVDEIIDDLLQSYDVTREKLAADIKKFIAEMTAQGMLVSI